MNFVFQMVPRLLLNKSSLEDSSSSRTKLSKLFYGEHFRKKNANITKKTWHFNISGWRNSCQKSQACLWIAIEAMAPVAEQLSSVLTKVDEAILRWPFSRKNADLTKKFVTKIDEAVLRCSEDFHEKNFCFRPKFR